MAQRDEAGRLVPDETAVIRTPEITREMRANARANPDSWLYVIDEAFDPGGRVPSWAVVGAYPVNADGEIIEDFHPNDRYRPSPKALGFPEPASELERLLQLVHTRHRPVEDLPPAVLDSTLFVYAWSPAQRTVVGFHDAEGEVAVPAYTTKSLAPGDWPHAREVLGRDIVESLGDHSLVLNPDDLISAVIPAADLREAMRGRR